MNDDIRDELKELSDAATQGAVFLIMKRDLYYMPESKGYTGVRKLAGRFNLSDTAVRFPDCDDHGLSFIHEDDAPEFSKACYEDIKLSVLRQERDEARAREAVAYEVVYEVADKLGYHCLGCGHLAGNLETDLKIIRKAGGISCCPERKMEPLSEAIRALTPPHTTEALNRMLAEARDEGKREAAKVAENMRDCCGLDQDGSPYVSQEAHLFGSGVAHDVVTAILATLEAEEQSE